MIQSLISFSTGPLRELGDLTHFHDTNFMGAA